MKELITANIQSKYPWYEINRGRSFDESVKKLNPIAYRLVINTRSISLLIYVTSSILLHPPGVVNHFS